MVDPAVILEILERIAAVPAGSAVTVPLGSGDHDEATHTLSGWCAGPAMNSLASATVPSPSAAGAPPTRSPGW